jgi:hypothetical protein
MKSFNMDDVQNNKTIITCEICDFSFDLCFSHPDYIVHNLKLYWFSRFWSVYIAAPGTGLSEFVPQLKNFCGRILYCYLLHQKALYME